MRGQDEPCSRGRESALITVLGAARWRGLTSAATGRRFPGRHPMRAGCVGVCKSRDLLRWEAAEPLWAPSLNPHHECPQVIRQQDQWYLLSIQRQDQSRVARFLAGPWLRPPSPYLGPHTVLAGSRLASDGKRWVSFPFLCAQPGKEDFGEVVQAEVYAIPRQLDFHADGRRA